MTSGDADVVIVGAGPAGAAAAAVLARSGKRVILTDRARFPRDKSCGDGLTGPALTCLDALGFDPAAVPSWRYVDQTRFSAPSGRALPLATRRGDRHLLAVATRVELDAALVDLARAAGARVVEEAKLESATADDRGVTLGFGRSGEMRAPYVVAADGAWSPTRRALEATPHRSHLHKWQAARTYVGGISSEASNEARVWFDPELLPGYAWSFPLAGGVANVGVGALRNAGEGGGWIVRKLDDLLQSESGRGFLGQGARAAERTMVWPIPTELRRGELIGGRGRVLFAGDAVGATDPMTGEGIAEALQTGALAGEALASGNPGGYSRSAGRALVWRHRRRQLCSDLLRSRTLAGAGLRVAGTTNWTRAQFTRWIFD